MTPEQMLQAAQKISAALEQAAAPSELPGFCITGSAAFLAYGVPLRAGDIDVVVSSMPHMQAAAASIGYTEQLSPMYPHLPATKDLPKIDILMASDFGFPLGSHDTEIQNGVRVPTLSVLRQNLLLDRRIEKTDRNTGLLNMLDKMEAELKTRSTAESSKQP